MGTNYYIAKISGTGVSAIDYTYIDTSEKEVLMSDFATNKMPPSVYVNQSKGVAFAKQTKIKNMQCVKESTFLSKIKEAEKAKKNAEAIVKASKAQEDKINMVNITPEPDVVTIDPKEPEVSTVTSVAVPEGIKRNVMKEVQYGKELCVPFCQNGVVLPPPTDGPVLDKDNIYMRATAGRDIADSEYVQLLMSVVSDLEKLYYATQYILQNASDEVAKYDRQRNDEEEYAEYFLLDVKRGFEFYKRFREIRQKRRFWKDLIQVAQIAEPFIVSFDVDELARISKCVKMARGRVYRLRDPEAFVHKERVCGKPAPEIVDSPKE